MKVKIDYTIKVSNEFRRALRFYYGKEGLASRKEIIDHCKTNGETMDDDIMLEYRESLDGKQSKGAKSCQPTENVRKIGNCGPST
jgi:hypothetical protein